MKEQTSKKALCLLFFLFLLFTLLLLLTCDFSGKHACIDKDGDGYGKNCDPGKDCNDRDAKVYYGAQELCDGKDNNCDGKVDEGCKCVDGKTQPCGSDVGECEKGIRTCIDGEWGPCEGEKGPAEEVCDGKDNDCDGTIDPGNAKGCTDYYYDNDGDEYGVDDLVKCLCVPSGCYTAAVGGDCDDENKAIHPCAAEICDGEDNDCDGIIDEEGCKGCRKFYLDEDGDGYGVSGQMKWLCNPADHYSALTDGDCNDADASIHPGAAEICDGKDNNCDGQVDENVKIRFYYDADGDGYGTSSYQDLCSPSDYYSAQETGDCDDGNKAVYPGAVEHCGDNIDNNCDGRVDETCIKGSRIFSTGDQVETFSIPSGLTVTYSKITLIGGGGGGDSGYYCLDSSGEVKTFGGGGGAGEVVVYENILEADVTYHMYFGEGGSGGSANSHPCSGTGEAGKDGGITRFVRWRVLNLFASFNATANGGRGASDTSGGEGYPGGSDGGSSVTDGLQNICTGEGGDNGSEYGRGGDGTDYTSPGGAGQDGVIIIEWKGY